MFVPTCNSQVNFSASEKLQNRQVTQRSQTKVMIYVNLWQCNEQYDSRKESKEAKANNRFKGAT